VQGDGVEGDEVSGQQPGSQRAQEGLPPVSARRGAKSSGGQNPSDGAGTDLVPESDEFSLDPAVAPGGLSCARRSTRTRISSVIGGRPDR
jgi:hypothetical protein